MSAPPPLHHRIPDAWSDGQGPDAWRARLLGAILVAAFVLGIVTAVPSGLLGIRDGFWTIVVADVVALTWVGVLAFVRAIPFRIRAWNFLFLTYALGVWFLATVGAVSQIYLMAVPLLGALLLGLAPALLAIAVNAITVVAVGVTLDPEVFIERYDGNPVAKWSIIALNLTFVSAVLTVALAVLLKRLESSLAEQSRITAAVDAAGEGVLIGDPSGLILYANRSGREILARASGDGERELRIQDLGHPAGSDSPLPARLASILPWRGDFLVTGEDGETAEMEVSIEAFGTADGASESFVAVVRDVTLERMLTERMERGERLEALGRLAGGVAHDFNNLIGSILGLAEEARVRGAPPEVRENLDSIAGACLRARDIVRQMMVFGRRHEVERAPVLLREVLEEALALVRASTPSSIELHTDFASGAHVLAHPGELHQIILNLSSNAVQAIGDRRPNSISIRLVDAEPHDGWALLRSDVAKPDGAKPEGAEPEGAEPEGAEPDGAEESTEPLPVPAVPPANRRHVCLSVTDTGAGIPKEHLGRIFDPFFTTRTEGSGLGLASVYGIVRSLDGDIQVYSEVGAGTTFRIYLPCADAGSDALSHRDDPGEVGLAEEMEGRRVLLVDDEETILRVAQRLLERMGYRVTPAANGVVALQRFREAPHAFDLIITDLTMPELGGADLIRAIRELRADLPAVLTSGFADSSAGRALRPLGQIHFLQKPFTQHELAHATRQALAGVTEEATDRSPTGGPI